MVNKKISYIGKTVLATGMLLSNSAISIFAEEQSKDTSTSNVTIQYGVNEVGQEQTFLLYQLFNVVDENGEQKFVFNETTQNSVKKVVSSILDKDMDALSEKDVLDYIDSLKNMKSDPQKMALRLFLEAVKNQMELDSIQPIETYKSDKKSKRTEYSIPDLSNGCFMLVEKDGEQFVGHQYIQITNDNKNVTVDMRSNTPSIKQFVLEDEKKELYQSISDQQIGDTVMFRTVGDIVDMSDYSTYKYTIHDSMDENLTFQQINSVKLRFVDKDGKIKEETLDSDEYEVVTEGLPNGETFQIRISDLKSIYTSHYGEVQEGQKVGYDGSVIVTYTTELNESALFKTGQEGINNTAQLEYSNAPSALNDSETGYSAEGKATVLTYALKVENKDADKKKLKNTKFRLYRDQACTQEVKVIETDKGYLIQENAESGETIISDHKGNFVIYGLDAGTYYLKEVEVPEGYVLLNGVIKVNVKSKTNQEDGVLQQLSASASYVNKEGDTEALNSPVTEKMKGNIKNGEIVLNIVNQKESEFPISIPYVYGILLGIIAGIFGIKKINKNKENKEDDKAE